MTQYEVYWYVENRVIFARPWGHHTIESAQAFADAITHLVAQGTAPVHLIVDDSGILSAPTHLNKLLRTLKFVLHPSFGWGIMIGTAPISHRFLIDMIGRLSSVQYKRLTTFDQALVFLQEQDQSIIMLDEA